MTVGNEVTGYHLAPLPPLVLDLH